jgi:prevent-host-death family protein
MSSANGTWAVAEAKAHLSEVIERAEADGPQTITRHGRRVAIVVSPEEWERKTKRRGNLAEFLAASPLRDVDIDLERVQDGPREIDL